MVRLSSPLEDLREHYDVVVIGSGYGGGIAASRLARAGKKVCLLERGKEFMPGEFPDTELEAAEEMQVDLSEERIGSKTGLFNFHVNEDITVLVGCGLGGTSLINANVSLKADPRVFDDPRWPKGLIKDLNGRLEEGFKRAEEMLKPTPYPEDFPTLKKLEAQKVSAAYIKQPFSRPPINVNFKDQVNHVGVEQKACILCGDCVTGCNHTAKNTTQMNYLPDAWNYGAEIFTECHVEYVERKDDKWLVHFQPVDVGREKFGAPDMFVSADVVVVSAGTLGSTEIMLRSKQNGLPLSTMLGRHFTGNGDVLGFAYNADNEINGVGYGSRKTDRDNPCGPCITTLTDTRMTAKNYREGMVIEEGSIPGALAPGLPVVFAGIAKTIGTDTDQGLINHLKGKTREVTGLLLGAHHGAMKNTQTYLIMTHDSEDGVMELENDRLRISWPNVGREEIFKRANDTLLQCTEALGGTYVENPVWTKLLHQELVTVHPLGGCGMAEDASTGVVDHKGRVFSSNAGTDAHPGLYITDGSVMPCSLGVNPLFTISAISERNVALLAEERNWKIDYSLPSKPKKPIAKRTMGITFTETMRGYFSTTQAASYEQAAQLGKEEGSHFEFTLTVKSEDLEDMLKNQQHEAEMFGSVTALALAPEAMTVTDGLFNLFVTYPEDVDTRRMAYRMKLSTESGKEYYFEGFKQIHNNPGFDMWHDATTLYVTVYDGNDAKAPILGKGMLQIAPSDFLKQMTTMKVTNADNIAERLKGTAEFGKFFAGVLFETYGGIFSRSVYFSPDAPPRKKRPLRVSAPEVRFFTTEDGVQLKLTRYRAGSKGPVICSHGLGVSSRIFSTDTIETNLLEYLFVQGYDVWLLDYRASIELPVSQQQASGDDIAKYDYPAAVRTVRECTGAKDVQMVVHCYGSTTWTMAMLNGLQGVRSAVCSQVSTHMKAPLLSRLKTGLHVPDFLEKLGVRSLTAYADSEENWLNKLYDSALKLYPVQLEERCNNPVCHRITFLYSLLYEHDRLNELLHENLHELFGIASIRQFEHLALMMRKGTVVSFDGKDIYMPHLDRMAIPITFIHGAENDCFFPESTEITYNVLREKNNKALYKRHVIPGYGHIDCIFGKNAVNDVYPFILEHLDSTQ
ncbi:MAG: alpha/beta fold hydrolase [Ignavibacteria bacterium]|nr:alpha/beta fold hydrolase [Ignavibacteria bacterium]